MDIQTRFLHSFYTKMALAVLVSFMIVGLLLISWAQQLTRSYQKEVQQKLHLELADHLVHDKTLLQNGELNEEALSNAFHTMMILGPSFEFYVLDPEGRVITYSADPNKIKRMMVNLEPVTQFLSGTHRLPILGDDPRSINRQKIFSVAEIKHEETTAGYLYIIIGGEIYDSVVDLLQNSHIIKLGFSGLLISLLFSLIIVLWLFALLTRPLRRLADDMQRFRNNGFENAAIDISDWDGNSPDEIHRLGATFKTMAETLKDQYEQVKSIDELRRELISYVSHDLRTPLASLQGYLETWQLKHHQLPEAESEALIEVAMNNAQQMSRLVKQLFELAHLDSATATLNLEPICIPELVQDVLQNLKIEADEKQVALDINPKDPTLIVLADIEKIERVFVNLIENAIRHCEPGSTVSVTLARDEKITISVVDDGCGIPEADLPFIFDAHYRASNSCYQNRPHGGLGLAITRRILQLHHSDINVTSTLGKGTEFSFQLSQA
ncbi:sensor histidine kinase [Oleiphilus messinensis]|uniref:histidine kinase n=1 Tax=Oleiphilus messinensis TaxID=141451 RepID=A0A1Y0IEN3_9GAMM|nr:HAMP domain-containing sensor histidine kinase [Oleiphilus messinensis]ARU57824.1 sensor histidine kinase [Oleiphilus messinensis]